MRIFLRLIVAPLVPFLATSCVDPDAQQEFGIASAPIKSIYQRIWEVDQANCGVAPLSPGDAEPPAGFVVVDEDPLADTDTNHEVFGQANIPPDKQVSFTRFETVQPVFDFFQEETIGATAGDILTNFIHEIADTKPLTVARDYLIQENNAAFTNALKQKTWEELLYDFWFYPFSWPQRAQLLASISAQQAFDAVRPGLSSKIAIHLNIDPLNLKTNFQSLLRSPKITSQPALVEGLKQVIRIGVAKRLSQVANSTTSQAANSTAMGGSCLFEHVFLGNEAGNWNDNRFALGGYHFWYLYRSDQKRLGPGVFQYRGTAYDGRLKPEGIKTPEVGCYKFSIALPYVGANNRSTTMIAVKDQGSMFCGCSPEGLMALALVRFYEGSSSTTIDCAKVYLAGSRASDTRMGTFYPVFLGRECSP